MGRNFDRLLEDDQVLDMALRSMPRRMPPEGWRTSLRVVASQERARTLRKRNFAARWENARDWMRLRMDTIMRPFAVPLMGGVFSTVALFSLFVAPTYPVFANSNGWDVPTMLSTEASVKYFPSVGAAKADVVVDIYLDDQGKMVDYTVVSGANRLQGRASRNLENLLVFTTFTPATSFGKPTSAKMRMGFINLKG